MDERIEIAELKSSVYALKVDVHQRVIHLGFTSDREKALGSDVHRDCGFSGQPYDVRFDRTWSLDTRYQEYSSCGVGDYRPESIVAVNSDGSRAFDPIFKSFVRTVDPKALKAREARLYDRLTPHFRRPDEGWDITLEDGVTGLTIVLHYDFFRDYDLVQRSVTAINNGADPIILNKISSLTLDLPARGDMDAIHLHGHQAWERRLERVRVPYSKLELSSDRGISSHQENPSLILCDSSATEDSGECYLFSLVWSGDFSIECFREFQGGYRVNAGLNPLTFSATLKPGESFNTPCAVISYSDSGLTDLSLSFNHAVIDHLIPYIPANPPVLLNSWEGVMMSFDQSKLVQMAEGAKRMGCDLFVVDDGWFGHRDNDLSSLGDWFYDPRKLPDGLKGLKAAIDATGLKLGIWVEPEMISEDSKLFEKHPEWAIRIPGRKPNISRFQMVINTTREDVRNYLFERLDSILTESGASYLKWDFNRAVCDVWDGDEETRRRFPYLFTRGAYDLIERLLAKHPDVLLETCSGGGGRFDLGMLYFSPQIWGSDNTDAFDRARIEWSTSFFYPPFTMGAHISRSPNPGTGLTSTLMQRFETALVGTFGYELDPKVLSDGEIERCRELSRRFQSLSGFLRQADFLRLSDPETQDVFAYEYLSRDGRRIFVGASALSDSTSPVVHLRRLDPEASYRVGGEVHTGAELMEDGIRIPGLDTEDRAGDVTIERI